MSFLAAPRQRHPSCLDVAAVNVIDDNAMAKIAKPRQAEEAAGRAHDKMRRVP